MRSAGYLQSEVESERRRGIPGGALSAVAVALGVGGLMFWTLAANDPYWRLFDRPSVPAPAYETSEQIRAVINTIPVSAPSADSAAVRPERVPGAAAAPGELALLAPRPAAPLIAVPAAFTSDAVADAAVRAGWPDNPVPEPLATPAPGDTLLPVAAREMPALTPPAAPADENAEALAALDPVSVPGVPDRLWRPADARSEQSLALARAERVTVQRRLALAGFDPNGFDGIFGPRTREAIADFQAAWGFPATGYLDGSVLADLRARTDEAYAALETRRATRTAHAAPKTAPLAEARTLARADGGGCARDAAGRIIEKQSFGCDVKGLAEKVVSLGRGKLAREDRDTFAFRNAPGAER